MITHAQGKEIISLLQDIARALGARVPDQPAVAAKEETPAPLPRNPVSVIRNRGRGESRLVGEMRHQHPHEVDETGLPPAGGSMTPDEHWQRQPRGV